jgi:hypothetical protein
VAPSKPEARSYIVREADDELYRLLMSGEFCYILTTRQMGKSSLMARTAALEAAQDMANHSDPRTTKLYDRRKDLATLSEIERRIAFE